MIASPGLLERDAVLAQLAKAWRGVVEGDGAIVLVAGEAGVGKSSLVERFARDVRGEGDVATGACDALFTPRPLGPLMDVLLELDADGLARLDPERDRHRMFAGLIEFLRKRVRPVLLVFEDVHWADDATLDLLKFLGRRVALTRALLVLTWRDDEVGPMHPLRSVLGELPRESTLRITLQLLSEGAVAKLAQREASAVDPHDLHVVTGGNAFFVTEILGSGASGIPPTVRDAVLARASRLSAAAREALGVASLSPVPIEPALVEAALSDAASALDECVSGGMLRPAGDRLAFRHELARQTIREALPPQARVAHSRSLLAALRARGVGDEDLPRLAHHADEAGDVEAILAYAPAAAERARRLGAHREARAHFERALKVADRLDGVERARLLDSLATVCHTLGDLEAALAARNQAIALARAAGDVELEGEQLSRSMATLIGLGRDAEAEVAVANALRLLEPLPESRTLGMALRVQAALRMFARDNHEAIAIARDAMDVADRVGDSEGAIYAMNALGSAQILIGEEDAGIEMLERSKALAMEGGFDVHVGNAYGNLGSGLGEVYRFDVAHGYLDAGIAFAEARDQTHGLIYALSWRAVSHAHQGRWDAAARDAERVLGRPGAPAISRMMALLALGRLRSRRGDSGAWEVLDEALVLAERTGTLQRVGPIRAARAEAAWLAGDADAAVREARSAYPLALAKSHPWFIGELAYWQWKSGALAEVPSLAAAPFMAQMRGEARHASGLWKERLCPFEAARALSEAGDEEALKDALRAFDELGARTAAEAVRRELTSRGARGIPRGPRATTRINAFGLTAREVEILGLLARGLSNAAIAARLHRSERTVDHHVSAVLAKLGVKSREAAAQAAGEHGLLAR